MSTIGILAVYSPESADGISYLDMLQMEKRQVWERPFIIISAMLQLSRKENMRAKILAVVLMVVLFAWVELRHTGLGGAQQRENIMDSLIPQDKRIHAPGFVLKDLSGMPVDLDTYKGSVVLLGFWTTG